MRKWQLCTNVNAVWAIVAICGVAVTVLGTMPAMDSARAAARCVRRLSDIENMPKDQPVPLAEYKDACTDAKEIYACFGRAYSVLFYLGAFIVLVAVFGWSATPTVRAPDEKPQPPSPGDVANRDAPEK
jgi:uncharacterized membrane protein YesL